MPQTKHKYRVSVYLGKETYEKIEKLADFLGLPVATATKVLLTTGIQISEQLEKGVKINGESKIS